MSNSKNLYRLLGLDLNLEDLFLILLGNNPYLPEPGQAKIETQRDSDKSLILRILKGKELDQLIEIGLEHNLMDSFSKFANNTEILRVNFDEYSEVDGYLLPRRIIITKPLRFIFEMEYLEIKTVDHLEDRLFFPQINKDMEIYNLDDE